MKYIFPFLVLIVSMDAVAERPGAFVGFSGAQAVVEIAEGFDTYDESSGVGGGGGHIGYLFENNIITQASLVNTRNFSLFGADDSYELDHLDILAGYRFGNGKVSFTPKVGYAYWNLDANEGQFLNPGPEEKKKSSNGNFMWGAAVGVMITPMFEISLSYKVIDANFGKYNLSQLEFSFHI